MTQRRRILLTVAGILLAAYITGPDVSIAKTTKDVRLPCVWDRPNLLPRPCIDTYTTRTYVGLTFPSVQLFYADSDGTIEGFKAGGQ